MSSAGLSCGDCAKTVQAGVARLSGVHEARVNFAVGTLTVVADPEEQIFPDNRRARIGCAFLFLPNDIFVTQSADATQLHRLERPLHALCAKCQSVSSSWTRGGIIARIQAVVEVPGPSNSNGPFQILRWKDFYAQ